MALPRRASGRNVGAAWRNRKVVRSTIRGMAKLLPIPRQSVNCDLGAWKMSTPIQLSFHQGVLNRYCNAAMRQCGK
jgi:hypothetical protein